MLILSSKVNIAEVEAARALEAEQAEFRAARAAAVEAATVTIDGNVYNANERSISRMTSAVLAGADEPDALPLSWSMADTPPGVMTPITLGELRRALRASTEQLEKLWGR